VTGSGAGEGEGRSEAGARHRNATLREVAARAGVSIKTVSNVVNHHPGVRPTTRARVEKSVAELGYRPNEVARALRRGPDDSLTLIVPRDASGELSSTADQLIRRARELGCRIVEDVGGAGEASARLLVISG